MNRDPIPFLGRRFGIGVILVTVILVCYSKQHKLILDVTQIFVGPARRFSAFTTKHLFNSICRFRMLAVSYPIWNWHDLSDFSALSHKLVSIHFDTSIRIDSGRFTDDRIMLLRP